MYEDLTEIQKQELLKEKTMILCREQLERVSSILEDKEYYPESKRKSRELYLIRLGMHSVLTAIGNGDISGYEWFMSKLNNDDLKHYGKIIQE